MTDYYTTLGVGKTATQEEIKRAYKKLANIHHPDKGGDQTKFKEISAAYDTIGDKQKRAEYDNQQAYGYTNSYSTHHDFNDFFNSAFGGAHPFAEMFGRRQMRKNKDLNLHCQVSFFDSFTGKQLEAKFTLPNGKSQTVVIDVPPGIETGTVIRYAGLGDDSILDLPRGDLHVNIYLSFLIINLTDEEMMCILLLKSIQLKQ